MMRHRINHAFRLFCGVAVIAALAPCAYAQTASVLVSKSGSALPGVTSYPTVQEGVDEAVRMSREDELRVTVFIRMSTTAAGDVEVYEGPVSIPADANIHLQGVPANRSWRVIIENPASMADEPVIKLHTEKTEGVEPKPFIGPLDGVDYAQNERLVIEGLTLCGGSVGVAIEGEQAAGEDSPPVLRPTLTRCIILGNGAGSDAGVKVTGYAAPLIVNCSIGGYGAGTAAYQSKRGVWVVPPTLLPAADDAFFTDILFCTIMQNLDQGVYVETGGDARVRNTIVYRNGDANAPEEGGLVWQDDTLFIAPNHAPWNVAVGDAEGDVIITGKGLWTAETNPDTTKVFFGPYEDSSPRNGTEWTFIEGAAGADGYQTLKGHVPPAYSGAPGAVDVFIKRADSFVIAAKAAFTYTAAAGDIPIVLRAEPAWGPVIEENVMDPARERGNWIQVVGTGFEPDCEVWFDTDDTAARTLTTFDTASNKVEWLSSTLLRVKVPYPGAVAPSQPVDIFVVNPNGGTAAAGPSAEYEYRVDPALPRPDIVEITPNCYRDTEGDPRDARTVNADIQGWNFGPGAGDTVIVKIAGVVCPYTELRKEAAPDTNKDSFDELRGVRIPVAAFGAGGAYDVEVINTDGQRDVLKGGFTYYADGVAELDGGGLFDTAGALIDLDLPWRPSNFTQLGAAANEYDSRLMGTSFDAGLRIAFNDTASSIVLDSVAPGDGIVYPYENIFPHLSHTQREILFAMPGQPSDILTGTTAASLTVAAANVRDADGKDTSATGKSVEAPFSWLDPAAVGTSWFAVGGVNAQTPFPLTDDTPAAQADYYAVMQVTNWTDGMRVFIAGHEADFVDAAAAPAIYFQVKPSALPEGVAGPQDVTVVNGEYYFIAEKALWIPRRTAATLLPPKITSVAPSEVDAGGGTFTVYGSDFVDGVSDGAGDAVQTLVTLTAGASDVLLAVSRASEEYAPATYEYVSSTEMRVTLKDPRTAPVLKDHLNERLDVKVQHWLATADTGLAGEDSLPEALMLLDTGVGAGLTVGYPQSPAMVGAEAERDTLLATLTTLGYTLVATDDPAGDNVDVYVTYPGCDVPADLQDWVRAGHGLVQVGGSGLPLYLGASPSPVTYPGGVSVYWDPSVVTHPIVSGAANPDATSGYGGYMDPANASVMSCTGTGIFEVTASIGAIIANNVLAAGDQEQGRAVRMGWCVYGPEAGPGSVRMLQNAIEWAGEKANAPVLTDLYRADSPAGEKQRYGSMLGGDVIIIEGVKFVMKTGVIPRVTMSGFEARVLKAGETFTDRSGKDWTYSGDYSSQLYVVTPPAPGGAPATVDVAVLIEHDLPVPGVFEAYAPDDKRYTYVMDGAPFITSIEPNFIDRNETNSVATEDPDTADKAVYFTIHGLNFDDVVEVLFDAKGDGGVPELARQFYAVSPYEIVVRAPRAQLDLGLDDAAFDDTDPIPVVIKVRNRALEGDGEDLNITSNEEPVYYYDKIEPMSLRRPELAFNDAYGNVNHYVNVTPGVGSISVDPLMDPGPVDMHVPGPMSTGPRPNLILAGEDLWWPGKLALREDTFDNPVRDKAGSFSITPYSKEDLEFQGRPNQSDMTSMPHQGTGAVGEALSDIGADELQQGGVTALDWYEANITPNPMGKLGAGELSVEIRIRGLREELNAEDLFIVPQGGDVLNTLHHIPLQFTDPAGGVGIVEGGNDGENISLYYATNVKPITTVVARYVNGGYIEGTDADKPALGDIIADGHAAVYIVVSRTDTGGNIEKRILGFNYDPNTDSDLSDGVKDSLSDGGFITGDAIYGRHLLIDTIPPRFQVERYVDERVTPGAIITASNDIFTAWALDPVDLLGTASGNPNHMFPFPPLAMVGQEAAYGYTPATTGAPVAYNGVLTYPPRPESDADVVDTQAFFNRGSIANGHIRVGSPLAPRALRDLDLTVVVRMIDPPVMLDPLKSYSDADNTVIAGETNLTDAQASNRDLYTGLTNRQVAGFQGETFAVSGTTAKGELSKQLDGGVFWAFEGTPSFDDALYSASQVSGVLTTEADQSTVLPPVNTAIVQDGATVQEDIRSNKGFGFDGGARVMDHGDNAITATWEIKALDWEQTLTTTPFHAKARFFGKDKAANTTPAEQVLNPLHVWWITDTDVTIVKEPPETGASQFTIQWKNEVAGLKPEIGPFAGFMYRIYVNIADDNKDGIYAPDPAGWSDWSTTTSINQDVVREAIQRLGKNPDSADYWIYFVAQTCDAAGNVSPWLTEPDGSGRTAIFDGPDVPIDFSVVSRQGAPNGRRFQWAGVPRPDTRVTPVFYYGDPASPFEEDKGGNLQVTMPAASAEFPNVYAKFSLDFLYELGLPPDQRRIYWELQEEGGRIALGVVDPADGEFNPVSPLFPATGTNDVENAYGDYPARKKIMSYVFRAASFIDANANDQIDPGERIDPSWANVSFVVAPEGVSMKYGVDGAQPFKVLTEDE